MNPANEIVPINKNDVENEKFNQFEKKVKIETKNEKKPEDKKVQKIEKKVEIHKDFHKKTEEEIVKELLGGDFEKSEEELSDYDKKKKVGGIIKMHKVPESPEVQNNNNSKNNNKNKIEEDEDSFDFEED